MDDFMKILIYGECSQYSRETGADVWEWYQATPADSKLVSKALKLCNVCNIRWQCLGINYDNDAVIAGGFTPYERKLLKWKQVDNIGDTNWRSVDSVVRELRGEEE